MNASTRNILLVAAGVVGVLVLVVIVLSSGRSDSSTTPTQTPIVITATPAQVMVTATPGQAMGTPTASPTTKFITATPLPTAKVVTATPGPCPGAPTIEFFVADPATIVQGQSTTLRWGQVLVVTAVGIDQGVGDVPAPGQSQQSPARTITYTMIATGCGGQTQKSVTVTVNTPTGTPKPTDVPKPTNTTAPTDAPKPTNTPKPTDAPKPTDTPKPTDEPKLTDTPEPTETKAPCVSQIQDVQVSAPENPGNVVNVTAKECYGGEKGAGVMVVAAALDDSKIPVPGATVPSVDAGVNQQKTVNLSITRLAGSEATKSSQVEVCFQTPQGEKFDCVTQGFVMNWE